MLNAKRLNAQRSMLNAKTLKVRFAPPALLRAPSLKLWRKRPKLRDPRLVEAALALAEAQGAAGRFAFGILHLTLRGSTRNPQNLASGARQQAGSAFRVFVFSVRHSAFAFCVPRVCSALTKAPPM